MRTHYSNDSNLRRAVAQGAVAYVGGYSKAACPLVVPAERAAWCSGWDMERESTMALRGCLVLTAYCEG